MSWPSVPSVWPQAGAQAPAVNMGMYQQYALQQQSWEQWQLYQTQLAQWQAQYGEQYQQMQSQNINSQNLVQGGGFVAPPPLPDYQPPPPPPPVAMQPSEIPVQPVMQAQAQAQQHNLQQPPPKVQTGSDQQSDSSLRTNEPQTVHANQTQASASALSQERNFNFDQSHSQHNPDGFRRNNRNSRWANNNTNNSSSGNSSGNNNNRNNRIFGEHTNLDNRNPVSYDDHAPNDHDDNEEDKEEKSQEEVAFDIKMGLWEDQYAEWKRNNANHPDRNQYNDFVTKMEGCRKQLLLKRESLRQNRLERNRIAKSVQNAQNNPTPQGLNNPPPQAMNKNEMSTEHLDRETVGQVRAETNSSEQGEPIASSLFSSERCDSNATIPGLDLVSGEDKQSKSGGGPPPSSNAPPKCEPIPAEPDSNIVARVTNILGNPEIQSLLSNIQKQKIESATLQSNIQTRDSHENESQGSGVNLFNRSDNLGHFDKQQNSGESHRNPFRHNTQSDEDMSTQNFSDYDMNTKRGRYDFEHTNVNERSEHDRFDRFNRFDRGRNDQFTQQSSNQEMGARDFGNNFKRSKDFDTFNPPPKSNFNNMQIDFDEFRPIQVIDYQNKKPASAPFANPSSFSNIIPSNVRKYEDVFRRKIIEYDHKSKIHPWNWFCPVIQIEYNHTKNGLSLHEHPPPKAQKPEPEKRSNPEPYHRMKQNEFAKRDHFPLQQQNERYERGYQGERYHQSRFESRQLPSDMQQSYSRRNPQERNWPRNYQEWNTPQSNYGYNRPLESRNVSNFPGKDDTNTMPETSATLPPARRNDVAKEPKRSKFNLKELLYSPGRNVRPKKIVIIMRGVPGSGKSFISKLIKEKESEQGSVRILSIDDYFMVDSDGPSKQLSYEYDAKMEESYTQYLLKAFKKTLVDNLYQFVIIDCKNTTLNHLNEFCSIATSCQFTPYICELPLDLEKCLKNNIHNRSESDIRKAINEWAPTPSTYTVLDYSCLFNTVDDTEEISDIEEEKEQKAEYLDSVSDEDKHHDDEFSDTDGDLVNEFGIFKSKWDNDTTENKLARLDGTNKPMKHTTIEDYLQMDGWEPPPTSTNGKKRVRWADIEQKREQDKQRAIGFIVGQTDWKNLIDEPRDHSNALTAVKYIEKVRKN